MAGNSYTAAESEIKSDDIRSAVYENRVDQETSHKRLTVAVIFIAVAVVLAGLLAQLALWDVSRLSARVGELEGRVYSVATSQPARIVEVTPQPQAIRSGLAPVLVATATPVNLFSVKVVSYAASTIGKGAFNLKWDVVSGGNLTEAQAKQAIGDQLAQVGQVCLGGRDFSSFDVGPRGRRVTSFEGKPITAECWGVLESITGIKASNRLPQDAVAKLQGLSGTSDRWTLFVRNDGRILGYWDVGRKPPEIGSACLNRSLNAVGWEDEPYFAVPLLRGVPSDPVHSVLYANAFTGWDQWGPRIPDLCRTANMMPVRQPTWLKYNLIDDAHVFEFVGGQSPTATKRFDLTVQIHSDPEGCYLFPDEFPKGRNLVEVVGKGPVATIGTEDLILFHQSLTGGRVQVVYARVDGPNIEWFAPQGQTNIDWGDGYFYGPASINLSPMVDGIAPWISFGREDPSAYAVGDTIFHPKAAIKP